MDMQNQRINRINAHFNNQWALYQKAVKKGLLCHKEMFTALDKFLEDTFKDASFNLADFGCGDSSAIHNTLRKKAINQYVGIDSAAELIATAPQILQKISCEKKFICDDMATAIQNIPPMNIIFSSYALHHFSYADKVTFIQNCYQNLTPHGHFLLVDVVLPEQETRDEWLLKLEQRFYEIFPDFTNKEIAECLEHPRQDDFPESIETYHNIAKMQPWQKFKVLVDKEIFACMVFSK